MTSTLDRALHSEWDRLADAGPGRPLRFTPDAVAELPEPARRRIRHAVEPGAPLATSVQLTMRGRIRLGAWRPFTATQILAPDGFVWTATARIAGLPVSGFDRWSAGSGQQRWRVAGLVPVVSVTGSEVSRSAAGRLAAELTALLPTAYAGASWAAGPDPDTAVATWRFDGQEEHVRLRVDPDGDLREITMQRWGEPGGAPFARYPFGVALGVERTFDGVRIPTRLRAGWGWGTPRQTEGEFFSAQITGAILR